MQIVQKHDNVSVLQGLSPGLVPSEGLWLALHDLNLSWHLENWTAISAAPGPSTIGAERTLISATNMPSPPLKGDVAV